MAQFVDYPVPSTTAALPWGQPFHSPTTYLHFGDPVCPHCGKPPYSSSPVYTWTVLSATPPLTFSNERVERFAIEQGKSTNSALRAEEV